uniref:Ubiquitin-associated protein 2-like n=1 Tax=Sinocyclocheilus anshuiensis TaxID=1608454 RepID=A0A671PT75_9TELE
MMTSVGGSRTRGNWEQTQGQTQSQSQHKQRPQATAEQIRLAQMISDHNDADFEEKVKQLVDITGKDQDESMIALHDCNGDVNRAINILLEGSPDTDSWEMVGKKKGVSGQKESAQTDGGDEGKENREKGGERDVARRRGGAPRRGRGASRGREFRGQENGLDGAKAGGVAGRGMERGRRGRGRGRSGAGRRGGRFSAQGMGLQVEREQTILESLTRPLVSLALAALLRICLPVVIVSELNVCVTGAWRTATEEWGMEDWNEDLSETKIFTASSVASMPIPQENVTITAGQRIDLAVLLGKTPPSSSSEAEPASLEGPQPPSLSQSLVFSSSKQTFCLSVSFLQVSMLGKGFGDVGDPKGTTGGSTTGSQFLEQIKTARALAQLAAQHSQSGPPNVGPSTWDTSPTTLGQYDMKPQTEPVHSPFTKRQPYQPTSTSSSMMDAFLQDKATPAITIPLPKPSGPTPGRQNSSSPADPQASSPLPLQQHKLKPQKKRASITTKIPALAVEMPGSADISGLNLQFGALQFGSEPVLPEYDASAVVATTTPGNQGQNSLYTSFVFFIFSSCLLTVISSQHPSVDGDSSLHSSSFSSVSAVAPSSVPPPSSATSAAPVSHSVPVAPSSSVSSVSAQSTLGPVSSLTMVLNSVASMAPPTAAASSSAALAIAAPSSASSSRSTAALGKNTVTQNYSFCERVFHRVPSEGLESSRKAPPNLPPGVPPLLPNPYIMAPGLLHPYPVSVLSFFFFFLSAVITSVLFKHALFVIYCFSSQTSYVLQPQVYGYDDLQMLQTRIPLDYYSIPFATPTTALTGREGSLTSNPYSAGDLSKFGRGDASSPAPATTLAQPQQTQTQTHHTTQQPFLNPALPPGYSYTSLPYYTGVPGLPNTFQYGPAMFPVAPTSSKQHGVNVGVNASATPFQQASGYGSHGYSTGNAFSYVHAAFKMQ